MSGKPFDVLLGSVKAAKKRLDASKADGTFKPAALPELAQLPTSDENVLLVSIPTVGKVTHRDSELVEELIRGQDARCAGRYAVAAAHYERALALKEKAPYTHYWYARTLTSMGRTSEAETQYRRAIELKEKTHNFHYNYALLLAWLGRFPEAEEHFKRAIEIKIYHPFIFFNYAMLLEHLGRDQEAEEYYRRAAKMKNPIFNVRCANNLVTLGRPEEAEEYYKRAIEFADIPYLHLYYAQFLEKQGRLAEAEEQLASLKVMMASVRRIDENPQRILYEAIMADGSRNRIVVGRVEETAQNGTIHDPIVIPPVPTAFEGIAIEDQYLERRYGRNDKWTLAKRRLLNGKYRRILEQVDVTTLDGATRSTYFDVTKYYGAAFIVPQRILPTT